MNYIDFDPFAPEIVESPYATYRQLRDSQPVTYSEKYDAWFLFRYDDVMAAVHDPETFSSTEGPSLTARAGGDRMPTILSMDDPDHAKYRGVVSRMFTPRAVAEFEPRIRSLVRGHLDRIAPLGECDIMSELAVPVPISVVGQLLGVHDGDHDDFRRWAEDLVHQRPGDQASIEAAAKAAASIGQYFTAIIDERRTNPGDDLISVLLDAQIDGQPVGMPHILGYCFLFIVAGTETTTSFMGNATLALAAHPDTRRELGDDPKLWTNAIEELIRWDSPVQGMARTVTTDTEIRGVKIPANSRIQLRYGSGNRDERAFPDPDRLDIRRRVERHLAFGHGVHFCMGAALARMESRIILEELVNRIPEWEVDHSATVRIPSAEVRSPAHLRITYPTS